jgi:hypothetical protein
MLDENSALRGNMPQRNEEEGGKKPRLSFSPAASVWGQMGRAWTTDCRNAPRTTESITDKDYFAFFHQFLGFTNKPALAPFANVPCSCTRYFMGGDGAWDHLNSSEGRRRADLEVRNVRVAQKTDLLIDVTIRQPFIGAGRSGHNQGQLRNPDNPDHILESAAADKIRNYRDPYQRNQQVAFLPACMSTSGRIHGEFWPLIFFLSNKQADDYFAALGYQTHKEEFCHRRGVFFQQIRGTIGLACAQAVALRGAPTTARRH